MEDQPAPLPVLWVDPDAPPDPAPVDPNERMEQEISEDLDRAEKWQRAWELRETGLTFRAIAIQMGVTVGTAYKYVDRHLRNQAPVPGVDDYRLQHLARIAMIRKGIIQEARLAPREDKPWHFAAGPLIKLDEREALLTGLDRLPPPDRFAHMSDEELEAIVNGGGSRR